MSVSSTSSSEQQWLPSVARIEKMTIGEGRESRSTNVYRVKFISKDTLVLAAYQIVVSELEKKVETAVKNALQMPLVIEPLKLALPHLRDLTDMYKFNDPKLAARTGLSNEESQEFALRIQRMMIEFLGECKKKGMFEFTSKASIREWKIAFVKPLFEHLYSHLNFTAEEMPEEQQALSCFQFAVLKTNEIPLNSWVRQPDVTVTRLLTKLKGLGYSSVTHPKENDLVIYFITDDPLPQHMGVYKGNGMVLSKLGINSLVAHIHPVFSIHAHYGQNILFMTKK